MGVFDVLVGINLLREGLDIPEVSLVAILDADKQGFLRNETSLIQTIGRAARNEHGRVIMYGDAVSPQMKNAIEVTERRRKIQDKYNKEHGITPKSVTKSVRPAVKATGSGRRGGYLYDGPQAVGDDQERTKRVHQKLEEEMRAAAAALQFEQAAKLRDRLFELKVML